MSVDRALGISGVAVALPSLIQLALQFGGQIAQLYSSFRDAIKQADLHQTLIDIHLSEIQADLYFLDRNAVNFTQGVQERLVDILRELIKNYREVSETFSYARGPDGKIRRGMWAVKLKDALETLVQDMERWQRRFMEYIQLLHFTGFGFRESIEIPMDTIRRSLPTSRAQSLGASLRAAREEINVNHDDLCLRSLPVPDNRLVDVSHSLFRTPDAGGSRQDFVVEYRRYTRTDDVEYLKSVVRYTAQILAAADARTMHVLCCEGYVYRPDLRQFQIVLKFPPGMGSPRTLRDLLLDRDPPGEPSLTARVELCKQIATAALFMHTASLVHKAIRPEAILLLQVNHVSAPNPSGELPSLSLSPRYSPFKLGIPFLAGFGLARQETPDTYSSLRENLHWEQDLYSHPSRQGQPIAKYTMAHDIYSIGVILLEIGLWRSLIVWNEGIRDFIIDEDVLEGGTAIFRRMKEKKPKAGEELKGLYERLAEQELPCVMGERFSRVVLRCLNSVEEGFGEDSAEVQNNREDIGGKKREAQEAERVGLKYIKTVLEYFEDIKI
ncbi:MAG: hypothetical protein M1818_000631 [Claussenomyces sp. TS43310]|nr:MAG: hypothetical protein M1818_000631 [Claussenomyces sp. TS43310]